MSPLGEDIGASSKQGREADPGLYVGTKSLPGPCSGIPSFKFICPYVAELWARISQHERRFVLPESGSTAVSGTRTGSVRGHQWKKCWGWSHFSLFSMCKESSKGRSCAFSRGNVCSILIRGKSHLSWFFSGGLLEWWENYDVRFLVFLNND